MLSSLQERILIALAYYKYLTTPQLHRLGLTKNRRSIANAVKQLKDPARPYVDSYANSFVPGVGRLASFHFLTAKGKRLLVQSKSYNGIVKLHTGTKDRLPRDYFHRHYTLDCHIACMIHAREHEITVTSFARYFDRARSPHGHASHVPRTYIPYASSSIIADATILLEQHGRSRLFALEVHNQDTVTEIIKQIQQHLEAIRESSL